MAYLRYTPLLPRDWVRVKKVVRLGDGRLCRAYPHRENRRLRWMDRGRRITPIVRRRLGTVLTVAGNVSREAGGVVERDVNGALLNVA